jgi:hypothetical protein
VAARVFLFTIFCVKKSVNRKICRCCKEEKDLDCFCLEKKTVKGKLYTYPKTRCRECDKIYLQEYHSKNKERNNAKKREYHHANKEKIKEKSKTYREKHKERDRLKKQEWLSRPETKEKMRNYFNNRRLSDPAFKLQSNFRTRIRKFLLGKSKSLSSQEILGCSWGELKVYIESLFKEGMTWENHGLSGWHVDHIIPLSSGKTLEEIEKLCHYTNLQPLWWHENLSKGAKL